MALTLRCEHRLLTPRLAQVIDLASSCRTVCAPPRMAALQREGTFEPTRWLVEHDRDRTKRNIAIFVRVYCV